MLHQNAVVRLKHIVPANSAAGWPGITSSALTAGTVGAIVTIYTADSANCEYEVEFVDNEGYTLALLTLKEEDIELVNSTC